MKNFCRGSLWRKWDLHVHTIKSVFNNNFDNCNTEEQTNDKYVYELFSRAISNQISGIGITDYFSIEGYKVVKTYLKDEAKLKNVFKNEIKKDNKYLQKIYDISIFPNIELRLEELVVYQNKNKQDKIEVHVIFDNNIDVQNIEENFFSRLTIPTSINVEGNSQNPLTKRNLEALGRKIKSEQAEFNSRSDYEAGCTVAFVKFEELKKILDDNFKNQYLLLLAEDHITDVNWSDQGHLIRKKNLYAVQWPI